MKYLIVLIVGLIGGAFAWENRTKIQSASKTGWNKVKTSFEKKA